MSGETQDLNRGSSDKPGARGEVEEPVGLGQGPKGVGGLHAGASDAALRVLPASK